MKKKQIALFPFASDSNKYIDLVKSAYENLGLSVVPFVGWRSKEYDYISLNWYESAQDLKLYTRRIIVLLKLALEKKNIIWTVHNKKAHEVRNCLFEKSLIRLLLRISYKIIVHSKSTVDIVKYFNSKKKLLAKVVFVPHPNYIGRYGKADRGDNTPVNRDSLQLLFIGLIRPYKNIELLIDVVNELSLPNLKLKICGKADIGYQRFLNKLIGSNGAIITDFNFIKDDDIPNLIADSHLLVLPYNLESSLNSGTVILAFSYKRSVLSSLIGTLMDIDDKTIFFSYEYKTMEEHKAELKKQLLCIYQKYENKYDELLELGEKCYEYVSNNNNMENITDALSEVIKT
jgi:glycosyltransferase involved in cell wall biosynthesis